MTAIKQFLLDSYAAHPAAFFVEMFSVAMSLSASIILAAFAANPAEVMTLVYAIYLLGSTAGVYVYYARRVVWTLILSGSFTIVNAFGLIATLV